ncbi:MAG: hypothetical protein ACUVX8_07445 [Candidatus Zipacnadales bacterium]
MGLSTLVLSLLPTPRAEMPLTGTWQLVTEHAAFSPRDTAEGVVFDGKLWLSNAWSHGGVLTRDLWCSTDGREWSRVLEATPYDAYSEMAVYKGKLWAVKGSVWTSPEGVNWTKVLDQTPFGVRGYGELVVFKDRLWQLGSGPDVWTTTDGVHWSCVTEAAPYGSRYASCVEVFQDKLWVMGGALEKPNDPPEQGYPGKTTLNDVWCSADGQTWDCVLEHAPWAPRMWSVPITYAHHLWIVGGYDNVHARNLGDVWYTADGQSWQEFISEPSFSPRHEVTLYVYQDSLWLVAGNAWPVQNDVWRLTLSRP